MLNIVWPFFIIISFSFAILSGNFENLNSSIFEGANDAVKRAAELEAEVKRLQELLQ